MTKRKKQRIKKIGYFILILGLTTLDLIIPDPVPVIDELLLGLWTTILGINLIKNK